MATYTRYQCSVCHRTKDILKDNARVVPNYCVITKGCSGRLFPIGEFSHQEPTPPVAGLEDWYPRGERRETRPAETPESDVSLACSSDGSLVLALLLTETEKNDLGTTVTVKFSQRRAESVAYRQHSFKVGLTNQVSQSYAEHPSVANPHTEIAGRDLAGINARFDAAAISEGRVFVRVNGVSRFQGTQPNEIVLVENRVIFNSLEAVGATVSITVFQEKDTVERVITLRRNDAYTAVTPGAWSNVAYVENGDADLSDDGRRRWWLYTAPASEVKSLVTGSRLRLLEVAGISDADVGEKVRFVLAEPPYGFTDRNLSFYADAKAVHEAFLISVTAEGSNRILRVASSAVKEVFPPVKLLTSALPPGSTVGASFINPAAETALASSFTAPTAARRLELRSAKIIGPAS